MTRVPSITFRAIYALVVLPLITAGCAIGHYYGSISGQVVDKETREPLEGAAVVAVYNVSISTLGGPVIKPVDWQETKTDAKGAFTLESRFVFHPKFGIGYYEGDPEIYVAKPSYGEYGYHPQAALEQSKGKTVYVLPQLKSREDRLRWNSWRPFERAQLPYFLTLLNEEGSSLGLAPLRIEVKQ